jgi:hypothetical protein
MPVPSPASNGSDLFVQKPLHFAVEGDWSDRRGNAHPLLEKNRVHSGIALDPQFEAPKVVIRECRGHPGVRIAASKAANRVAWRVP